MRIGASLGFSFAILFVAGCGEPPEPPTRGYVSGLNPAVSRPGGTITILGQMMGSRGTVFLPGGKTVVTPSWTPSAITVKLPDELPPGRLELEVRGEEVSFGSTAITIAAPPPTVRELKPEVGMVGATITLLGTDLGDRSTHKLMVYGARAKEFKEWTPSRIVFTVPALPPQLGDHAVWVEGPDGTSKAKDFAIVRPCAWQVVPDPALAGKAVTILGRDFGTGSAQVLVGHAKKPIPVLEWGEKRIRARLPEDLSGDVEVRVVNDNGGAIPIRVHVLAPPPTGRTGIPAGHQVAMALDDVDLPYILTFNTEKNAISLSSWGRNGWSTTQLLVRLGKHTGDLPRVAAGLETQIQQAIKEDMAKKGTGEKLDAKIRELTVAAQKDAAAHPVAMVAAGHCPRIVIDASRRLHVTMFDMMHQKIVYGLRALEDAEWEFEHVSGPTEKQDGMFSAVAVDPRGRVHIAYMNNATRQVHHATRLDGGWVNQAVDPEQDQGVSIAMALDAAANPVVAYLDFGKFDLKAAIHDGKAWKAERVDEKGWTGDMPSMAMDDKGNPHIAYLQRSDDGKAPVAVKLAVRASGAWTVETVDSGPGVGNQPVIGRDAQGHLHLAYLDDTQKAIRYAVRKGPSGPWDKQTMKVDGLLTEIQPSLMAMAVASDGTARLVYWTLAGNLEYRQMTPR